MIVIKNKPMNQLTSIENPQYFIHNDLDAILMEDGSIWISFEGYQVLIGDIVDDGILMNRLDMHRIIKCDSEEEMRQMTSNHFNSIMRHRGTYYLPCNIIRNWLRQDDEDTLKLVFSNCYQRYFYTYFNLEIRTESAIEVAKRLGFVLPKKFNSGLGKFVKTECADLKVDKIKQVIKYPAQSERVEFAVALFCMRKDFQRNPIQ